MFEVALAIVDEDNPDRWEVVAAMVGGKNAEDVKKHYRVLLEDLQYIESGKMDHKFEETQLCLSSECTESVCWTDEDQKYVSLSNLGKNLSLINVLYTSFV